MVDLHPLLEDQLKKKALLKNKTPEQLLKEIVTTHSKTSGIEEILLEEKESFCAFLNDYKKVLRDSFFILEDIYRRIDEQTDDEALKNVFDELSFFLYHDPSLFVYLYKIYKDQISDEAQEEL